MERLRRVSGHLSSTLGGAGIAAPAAPAALVTAGWHGDEVPLIDFGHSFLTGPGPSQPVAATVSSCSNMYIMAEIPAHQLTAYI